MLASLLPGLRDLRTPLAVGYLWIVVLWLILHEWVPKSVEQATGPIKSLYELSSLLGTTVTLAALSFVAYLLGSILSLSLLLRWRSITNPGLVVLTGFKYARFLRWWLRYFVIFRGRAQGMAEQLRTFMSARLREENAARGLDINTHMQILREPAATLFDLTTYAEDKLQAAYVVAIAYDLESVGIQLQAKNRDFWDTYDREAAEADFRYGIFPPIAAIICILAFQSDNLWWLLLLAAPIVLFILGTRHSVQAAATLVQAVVLKMVEPPVLERLRETMAKKLEKEKKPAPSIPQVTTGTLNNG